jgi:HK97 family phage prohead protease
MTQLTGYFARFGEWTTIRSAREGAYLERIHPGAFARTLAEDRGSIRALFEHGHDAQVGFRPLGTITQLEEDRV